MSAAWCWQGLCCLLKYKQLQGEICSRLASSVVCGFFLTPMAVRWIPSLESPTPEGDTGGLPEQGQPKLRSTTGCDPQTGLTVLIIFTMRNPFSLVQAFFCLAGFLHVKGQIWLLKGSQYFDSLDYSRGQKNVICNSWHGCKLLQISPPFTLHSVLYT